jgi:hypothetical protein
MSIVKSISSRLSCLWERDVRPLATRNKRSSVPSALLIPTSVRPAFIFPEQGNMAANEPLGNLPLFTLCEDSSIWERLMSIRTPTGTQAEFLLPAPYYCQSGLRQQSNGQERFCNIGSSETLEIRFVDFRMEVVLQVEFAAIRDQAQ